MKQSGRFASDLTLEAVHHCLSSAYTQCIYHFSLCQPAVHLKSHPAEYFHLVLILIEEYSHYFYCLLCLISNRHKYFIEGSRQVSILVYNFFPDTAMNPFTVILVLWTTTCLAWNVLCKSVNKKGVRIIHTWHSESVVLSKRPALLLSLWDNFLPCAVQHNIHNHPYASH